MNIINKIVLLSIFLLYLCITPANSLENGVNLMPSYYNNGDVTFGWDLMKQYPAIKTVRIEIEPDKATQAATWINQAVKNGYEVIATYHKYTVLGSDDVNELKNAAIWWTQNYNSLISAGSFTINLMNEWGSHNQNPQSYASAYNEAIAILRKVYQGYVIIDVAGWGQETTVAAKASSLLSDPKIIFSAHIYPQGWNQGAGHHSQASDMDEMKNSGRRCIIGEYGTKGDGPVDVINVVKHAKSIGFEAVLAWAWNGDGGDMNMVSPKWAENAKASSYSKNSYFCDVYAALV